MIIVRIGLSGVISDMCNIETSGRLAWISYMLDMCLKFSRW